METQPTQPIRLLTKRQAQDMVGCKASTMYRLAREGQLCPVKITEKATRWIESEVHAFIAKRIADRDAALAAEPMAA